MAVARDVHTLMFGPQIGLAFYNAVGAPVPVPFAHTYKDNYLQPQTRAAASTPRIASCFCDTHPDFLNLYTHRLVSHVPSFFEAGMIQYELGCIMCKKARRLYYNDENPANTCTHLRQLMALPLFHESAFGVKERAAARPKS